MRELQELNPDKDTASNAQILFLVLNASSITLLPVTIFTYRAQMGAPTPPTCSSHPDGHLLLDPGRLCLRRRAAHAARRRGAGLAGRHSPAWSAAWPVLRQPAGGEMTARSSTLVSNFLLLGAHRAVPDRRGWSSG
jgi:hypothetical protein